MAQALVSGSRKIVAPCEVDRLGRQSPRDFARGIARPRIDDHDFVEQLRDRRKTVAKLMGFITDNHHKGDRGTTLLNHCYLRHGKTSQAVERTEGHKRRATVYRKRRSTSDFRTDFLVAARIERI